MASARRISGQMHSPSTLPISFSRCLSITHQEVLSAPQCNLKPIVDLLGCIKHPLHHFQASSAAQGPTLVPARLTRLPLRASATLAQAQCSTMSWHGVSTHWRIDPLLWPVWKPPQCLHCQQILWGILLLRGKVLNLRFWNTISRLWHLQDSTTTWRRKHLLRPDLVPLAIHDRRVHEHRPVGSRVETYCANAGTQHWKEICTQRDLGQNMFSSSSI